MNLLELRLPSLTGSDPETQLLQLRSYLYQLQEQLQYVLSNLDTENMSEELRTRLQDL